MGFNGKYGNIHQESQFQHQPGSSHPVQWDRQEGERQRIQSFSSPFSTKNAARQGQPSQSHCCSPASWKETQLHGSELFSKAPISSSHLLRCTNPLQLAVDIISFSSSPVFKLLSNINAFSSHFHPLDLLQSF